VFNVHIIDINSVTKKNRERPLEDLLSALDYNKDKYVDINEFIEWSTHHDIDEQLAMIHFQKADINHDGRIDTIECRGSRNLMKLAHEVLNKNNEL